MLLWNHPAVSGTVLTAVCPSLSSSGDPWKGEGDGAPPVFLPGESHGWRSPVGCSPWGLEESDTTERLHFHFSLSRIGEGNGDPLQCSCLENPRDGGAWRAAVYAVAQIGHDWSDLAAADAWNQAEFSPPGADQRGRLGDARTQDGNGSEWTGGFGIWRHLESSPNFLWFTEVINHKYLHVYV